MSIKSPEGLNKNTCSYNHLLCRAWKQQKIFFISCLLTCPLVIPFLFHDSLIVFVFSKLTTLFLLPCQNLSANSDLISNILLPWGFFKSLLSLARCCQSVSCCLSCVLVTLQCSGKCEYNEDQNIMTDKSIPTLQHPLLSMTQFSARPIWCFSEYSEDTIKELPMYPLTIRTGVWITGIDQKR